LVYERRVNGGQGQLPEEFVAEIFSSAKLNMKALFCASFYWNESVRQTLGVPYATHNSTFWRRVYATDCTDDGNYTRNNNQEI